MTATITIYSHDGTVQRAILDPTTWSFDERGVFHVLFTQFVGGPNTAIATTLPVLIERQLP
jgi:hypothetical protein